MVKQDNTSPRKRSRINRTHALNRRSTNILTILNALPFYVLLVDEDHHILEANNAVYAHLGLKRSDIVGGYCPLVVHGVNHAFAGCPLEEAAEKNQAIERELFDPQSGRWVISSIYPTGALSVDNKRVFLHLVTDITESKQTQEALKISHEQLRTISSHLESVREEEKRKIARDLHDETSQLLTSIYAHLEAAITILREDPARAEFLLRKAQTISTAVLDEIHALIYELRPALLDTLGLVEAVGLLRDSLLKAAGIKVNTKITGKVRRFISPLEIALFRIIQEAFNNITYHAHATEVSISFYFKKDRIKVFIKDNGAGFDVQEAMNSVHLPRGLGLMGMRERAELLNGNLTIKSCPGQGTEIIIDVPLTAGVSYV